MTEDATMSARQKEGPLEAGLNYLSVN